MHIEQVKVVKLKPCKHFVNRLCRHALAVLAWPQLAGNPDFRAGNAAFLAELFDHPPDAPFRPVCVSRVYVAVAVAQSRQARFIAHFVRRLCVSAESELRHLNAVIERDERNPSRCFCALCQRSLVLV